MAPSAQHNQLAVLALNWLRNKTTLKGIRGTTEVFLDQGYVADAVALCSLQNRFFQRYCEHSKLEPMTGYPRYQEDKGKVVYETRGDVGNYFACIFEVKVSRADFLSTFGKGKNHANRHEAIGSLHWCVTPKGLIKPDELPDFWGLLEPYGSGLTEKSIPTINILTDEALFIFAHQLIWPLQAYRHDESICCEKCGVRTPKGYCVRCYIMKKPVEIEVTV